jgi:tetratricopeptide (TPR) repeat protein
MNLRTLLTGMALGLSLLASTAHAGVQHAAYHFTVTSDSLDGEARERLAREILRAVSRTDGVGEAAVALYSPTCVVHWSPQDLSHDHSLEEVAERCLGFDLVVRGHVAHLNSRAHLTLQIGLMQGRHLLVLPAIETLVDVGSPTEIPVVFARLFMRTWPVTLAPSPSEGHWGAGRDAGLQPGDRLWPLGALPPDRAALAAALEETEPVEVASTTATLSRLGEDANPETTYIRVPAPGEERLFAWQGAVLDGEGQSVDFGTLSLSDDSGWSVSVDLAETGGRCVADIPLGTPLSAQIVTPRGTVFFDSLLLDPMANDKETWRWADTIRDVVADLRFVGESGEEIAVLLGDDRVGIGGIAPPISRRTDSVELIEAPAGVIAPFTYEVSLAEVADGATIVLPLFTDHLTPILDMLEQGDLEGATARFREQLEPTRADAHPQYADALAALLAHCRQGQIAERSALAQVWSLHFDPETLTVLYPEGPFVRTVDTLGVLTHSAELARALALVGSDLITPEVAAAIRADLLAVGGPILGSETFDVHLRRSLVSAHLDLYDAAQALAGEELRPEHWMLLETLAADLEEITMVADTGALADERLTTARETHRRLGARLAERRSSAERDRLVALRAIHRPEVLGIGAIDELFAQAEASLADPETIGSVDFDALEARIGSILGDSVERGRARLAATRSQREALRAAGYLFDVTQMLDRADSEVTRTLASGDLTGAWQALSPALAVLDETGLERWDPSQIREVAEVDQMLTDTLEEVRTGRFPGCAEALVAAQGWRHDAQESMARGEIDAARRRLAQANDHLREILRHTNAPAVVASIPPTEPSVIPDTETQIEVMRLSDANPSPSVEADAGSVSELLHWGTELFRRGNYVGARRVFRRAREMESQGYLAWFGEGRAAFAVGDYRGASRLIREGLNLFPMWTDVQINRRDFYDVVSDYDAQLNLAELHVRQFSGDTAALFCLGYNLYYDGAMGGAASLLAQIPPGAAEFNAAQHYLNAISMR